MPINHQDHIIEAIKQVTADPIELQSPADPDANPCPKCGHARPDGDHCDSCVSITITPALIRSEHRTYIDEIIDTTGLTDSTTIISLNKLIINSVDASSGKPREYNLSLSPSCYGGLWHGLHYYVNAERIDIKRIYRPNKKNDLLKITITERKN